MSFVDQSRRVITGARKSSAANARVTGASLAQRAHASSTATAARAAANERSCEPPNS